MAVEEVRNRSGRLIGRITTLANGNRVAYDTAGRLKGTYYPRTHETIDSSGRRVGTGDMLAVLIRRISV